MSSFVGQIVIILNGFPTIWCKSLDYTVATNRELVMGMSPTGDPLGFTEGTNEYDLTLEMYLPKLGDLPWKTITNALIVCIPRDGGAGTMVFRGAFVVKVGKTFNEKGAATRRVEMRALGVIEAT